MKFRAQLFVISTLLTGMVLSCSDNPSEKNTAEVKIPVHVATVQRGEIVRSSQFNGSIEAEFEVKVFSKIPDRIERFFADDGDYVEKGAPIAQIRATTIEQAVRQAEASLTAARAQEANLRVEYERMQRLYRENATSKQQFDAVETQYKANAALVEQAEAGLASAKSQLHDATLIAPIAGIIGKRYYETGDLAGPALPVVSIVQMDRVKVRFDATEEDLGKLSPNQQAMVRAKSYPNRTFSGKLSKISPILDPMTRMASIEVLLENPNHLLKPGMYAEVEIITEVMKDVIVVPRHATIESTSLREDGGLDNVVKEYFVFVVDSSRARQRLLEVAYLNHIQVAVANGVQIGDQLVISGQNKLRDGVAVQVVNAANSDQGSN